MYYYSAKGADVLCQSSSSLFIDLHSDAGFGRGGSGGGNGFKGGCVANLEIIARSKEV
jgi:hypothetical protein